MFSAYEEVKRQKDQKETEIFWAIADTAPLHSDAIGNFRDPPVSHLYFLFSIFPLDSSLLSEAQI